MKNTLILIAVAAGVALSGCASKGAKGTNPQAITSTGNEGISTAGAGDNTVGAGSAIGNGAAIAAPYSLTDKIVYFAYDGVEIDAAGQTVVNNFGKYLVANAASKVRLEGHADERGSREYNVALGERRGQSVARALKAAGASEKQLSVTSYGEERPIAAGHDEEAYAKNRRVEIVQ